jgi:hypothetical protein
MEAIMWTKFRRWWATEGEMVRLRGLDDRLLADMGLQREGLRDRVQGVAQANGPMDGKPRQMACDAC